MGIFCLLVFTFLIFLLLIFMFLKNEKKIGCLVLLRLLKILKA